jgi:endonuclease/exonuclease/phosphatase family metal-dependent hydrolase
MRFRLIFASVGCAAALSAVVAPALSVPADAAGTAVASRTTTVDDVRVGSFNLSSLAFDSKAGGDHEPWKVRRPVVVEQIINQKVDVLGLQEANQSSIYPTSVDYGVNQYMDLKGALAAQGRHFALTNENAYNCAKPASTYQCQYSYQGASQDNRILYNTDRVSMLDQGSVKYATQTVGKNERYLAWGVFKMKATGKEFFFTDTHLDPYSADTRKAQWSEMIDIINRLKGTRPVVAVGDFNTSKYDDYAATFLPRMKSNGYGDVLGQQFAQSMLTPMRAETTSRRWVNSYNGFQRDVRGYSYEDNMRKAGNGIDWIFATNSVRVKQWAVAVRVDTTTMKITGIIPSDHSMVRATLVFN